MHLLMLVAILAVPAGFAAIGLASWDGIDLQRRRGVKLAGAAILGIAIVIFCALRFAEPTVCRLLGGDVVQPHGTTACRNEWGGNGNNDPGSGPWPWT